MRKLIKDSEGNLARLNSLNGLIPDGWTEVPAEELDAEELNLARTKKMSSIRSQRDEMLLTNDKLWLIASKKGEDTAALEADADTLRDLPEAAQTALDALETTEEVEAYDAFADLELAGEY